jgi:hypothetical protein
MIKLRRMRWVVGLVGYWWESQREGDHKMDYVGGCIILRWILEI